MSKESPPPSTEMKSANNGSKSERTTKIISKLLVFSYVLGLFWTCLHPIFSVLTGEAKCRGWFLDEHSIEIRFVEGKQSMETPKYLLLQQPHLGDNEEDGTVGVSSSSSSSSLCNRIHYNRKVYGNRSNLICHTHGDYFEVAMVTPLSNALDATEEAIVLIFPSPANNENWSTSRLHVALLRAIAHLADPFGTPWLAKSVLLVTPVASTAPTSNASSAALQATVSSFLDAYLGPLRSTTATTGVPPLPPHLCKAIIRNFIVLDVHDTSKTKQPGQRSNHNQENGGASSGRTHFAILPQGRRGVLPNADLVFLVGKLFERATFMNTRLYPNTDTKQMTFLTHGFTQESMTATAWIEEIAATAETSSMALVKNLDKKTIASIKEWAKDMVNMVLFARTLALGPSPPHADALDRGIDSLTIQVDFDGTFRRDPSVELVQYVMEYVVRALGNLHERLHHSFTLYLLLSSPRKFVSHMEYFLPNILLLLPLALRAFGLLLPAMIATTNTDDNKGDRCSSGSRISSRVGLNLRTIGRSLLLTLVVMTVLAISTSGGLRNDDMIKVLIILYAGAAFVWTRLASRNDDGKTSQVSTLQFTSCVMAAYILAPIAFAHTSLSYVPSMLWAPLFAFPDYARLKSRRQVGNDGGWIDFAVHFSLFLVCIGTFPPILLVPQIFPSYTPFVQFAYIPLHLQLFLLLLEISIL